jgi:hypothetical protein
MADTIERLYKLTVDGTQAARQLTEVARATDNLDKRMASAVDGVMKFGKQLAAAFAVGTLVNGIQRNIDAMDDLSKAVAKVGIGAEDLQRLRYAADLSGVSAEQLDKAVGKLAIGMGDLAKGTSDTAVALRSLGAKSGEGPVETLKRISDQFQKMPDGIEKTSLAIQLFGKTVGPDMIPLLNAGGDALQDLANEADKFGGVLSGGTLQAAEAFNDNLSRLQRTASGIGAQLSAGLLPMLVAITDDLTGATKAGDGFVSTGQKIGDVLLDVYGIGLKAAATLEAFGLVLAGLAAAATNPMQAKTILGMMVDDVNALGDKTNERLQKLAENIKKVQESTKGSGERNAISNAFNVTKIDSAADAAEKLAKANEKMWKEVLAAAKAQETLDAVLSNIPVSLSAAEQQILAYDRATIALTQTMEAQFAEGQAQQMQLQILTEWFENGTAAQKEYARAQLAATASGVASTETMKKQRDEMDVLAEGADAFFDNLGKGAADFEDVFERAVQSIIAQLLKLWAKKYIVDAIAGAFGFAPAAAAAPAAGPQAVATSQPAPTTALLMQPMALVADTSASMSPLRFGTASAGMQSDQQSQMKVTVNNYSSNQVTTRQRAPNDIEIIVSEVKASMAADFLRGGNDVSHAAERAWGLSRGTAAAF